MSVIYFLKVCRKTVIIYFSLCVFLFAGCVGNNDPQVLFDRGDYERALVLWHKRASQGDPLAQNYVGIHYYLGLGTKRNHRKASTFFNAAAEQGFGDAQYNLGVMYENGEYVEQDYMIAAIWYSLAIENGNQSAKKRMQAILDEHKLLGNQYQRVQELTKEYR